MSAGGSVRLVDLADRPHHHSAAVNAREQEVTRGRPRDRVRLVEVARRRRTLLPRRAGHEVVEARRLASAGSCARGR